MAARGALLVESQSEGFYGRGVLEGNQSQISHSPRSITSRPAEFLFKLKAKIRAKFYGVWLWTVQTWPTVTSIYMLHFQVSLFSTDNHVERKSSVFLVSFQRRVSIKT